MDALVVRPAGIDDLEVIVALRLALLHEYGGSPLYGLHPDAPERARALFLTQLISSSETMFLAERSDRVVGILRCVDSVGSPLLQPDRFCYVSSAYVVPAERRRGVLRRLVVAAERWCADRGITEMRLHNSASSRVAADTWQAFGFEVVEEVRRRVLGADRGKEARREHAKAH